MKGHVWVLENRVICDDYGPDILVFRCSGCGSTGTRTDGDDGRIDIPRTCDEAVVAQVHNS